MSAKKPIPKAVFYSNIENLELWARSEEIGFAVNLYRGVMECWNTEDPR
jgi:hypothetical protein